MEPRILVAGIGNIFLGDDAFGCEVAGRLMQRSWPASVTVRDFGIRGLDLAYAMLEDYEAAVLVDATPRGGEPGTLYVIEPDLAQMGDPAGMEIETHGMDPMHVLNLVKRFGGQPRRVLVVGAEPATCGGEQGQMGLSEPVAAVVDEAADLVASLVDQLYREVTGEEEINAQTSA